MTWAVTVALNPNTTNQPSYLCVFPCLFCLSLSVHLSFNFNFVWFWKKNDLLIVRCLTPLSTIFQLYHGGQCTYPCFSGVLLTSTTHNILSKPVAAFPHYWKNGQQWERNESCCNDYHQSSERILAEQGIVLATSCSQVHNTTDWAMGLDKIKGLKVLKVALMERPWYFGTDRWSSPLYMTVLLLCNWDSFGKQSWKKEKLIFFY